MTAIVKNGFRPWLAALVVVAAIAHTSPARTETFPLEASRPYAPFVALNLDAGLARNFTRDRFRWLGAAAAGVGLFNGSHVWDFTAGLRDTLRDRRELTVSVARQGVENGFGFHAEGLCGLAPVAAGVGAGLSFSILNAEAAMLFDHPRTKYLSLFLRVPVGMIVHAARSHAP
jgi:hypothetical protein